MTELIKGADLSTLLEVEECGGKFYDDGREADALTILKDHGIGLVRLRLWNDPYSPEGEAYGAGTCDLPRVMRLAERAADLGLPWMLDFHYSDFWADPGKQFLPKAWQGLDEDALVQEVYYYTRDVLLTFKSRGLFPSYVAVGNEITAGLLWPVGKRDDPGTMIRLLNAGIRAVRDTLPAAKVLLHLDNGGNNALYRDWFDAYFAQGGADFDIIGLSYYPFWHGTPEDLQNNLTDLAARYHKPMMIAETAMAFTYGPYQLEECLTDEPQETEEGAKTEAQLREGPLRKPLAASAELGRSLPWPGTPRGQADFLRDLADVIHSVPDGLCLGLIWWEAAWIPVPGSGWATEAALEYIHAEGPGGNEWANMALFDYSGNALPALKALEMI